MQLEVSLPDPEAQAVIDLHQWLAGEPLVRRFGDLRRTATAAPERMGTGLDVLTLVVGAGLSTAQLLLAIVQWRQSRPSAPTVTVTRTGPDGVTVRIDGTDPDQVAALANQIEAG